MKPNTKEIEKLLSLEIEELELLLGDSFSGKSAFSRNSKENIILGRKWMLRKKEEFQKIICNNKALDLLMSEDEQKKDKVNLVFSIADLIAGITTGVPPFVISVLIVKIGVKSFCGDQPASME